MIAALLQFLLTFDRQLSTTPVHLINSYHLLVELCGSRNFTSVPVSGFLLTKRISARSRSFLKAIFKYFTQ